MPPALTTWFDLDRLEGGDDYDRKIQRNIARCSFLHPGGFGHDRSGASRATSGASGATRVDRARNIADGALFILPVCIDDTTEADALVPEQFKALHFTRLPAARSPPEFAQRLQDLARRRGS